MKQFFRKLLPAFAALCAVLTLLIMPFPGHAADFGDFGGDQDFGGWDDGGGWDGGGWDNNDWRVDWHEDHDDRDGYHNTPPGPKGPAEIVIDILTVILCIGILVLIIINQKHPIAFSRKKKKKEDKPAPEAPQKSGTPESSGNTGTDPPPPATPRPMQEYLTIDPRFSEAEFRSMLSNLYIRFQNCWQAKDLSELRPYLTDTAFAQFDRQLDAYRQNGQTNHVERIAVLNTRLLSWQQEGGMDVITARLETRIVDYVTEDGSNKVIRGSRVKEKFMTYEWTLERSSGRTTGTASGLTAQTCPHCGAAIDINRSAKCPYCDTILSNDSFDWVVSNIKCLAQRTKK